MKKFFIYFFLSLSTLLCVSAFISKANNNSNISFRYVLNEIKDAPINFNIGYDIKEFSDDFDDLSLNTSFSSGDILGAVVGIGKTIYYGVRLLVNMSMRIIQSCLNTIIVIFRCVGISDIPYVNFSLIGDEAFGSSVRPGA